ncbi:MAG: hypothetical protein IJF82_02270 [Achromobacter sp.]|nr:hypothetical protein [Achromobacter sp.]
MVSNAGLALAVAVAPASMLACLAAARRRADGQAITAGLPLPVLAALAPDVVVTAAFGQILSQRILDIPPLGTLNVHASLLPKHRGSAPINWSIAMGDAQTGVTIMFTDRGLDTGDMAISEAVDIGPEETAGELSDRLSLLGARLLVRAIHLIEDGSCPRVPQDETLATYEPMLKREDGLIDWAVSARKICD